MKSLPRNLNLSQTVSTFLLSLFILASCSEDDGLACTTNSVVNRSTSGEQCAMATVKGYAIDENANTESITIQFNLPTYNCRLNIDPTEGLIEETTYALLDGVSFTQTDIAQTSKLSAQVTSIDRTTRLISGSFDFSGSIAVSGGLAPITYKGTFTDVEF